MWLIPSSASFASFLMSKSHFDPVKESQMSLDGYNKTSNVQRPQARNHLFNIGACRMKSYVNLLGLTTHIMKHLDCTLEILFMVIGHDLQY